MSPATVDRIQSTTDLVLTLHNTGHPDAARNLITATREHGHFLVITADLLYGRYANHQRAVGYSQLLVADETQTALERLVGGAL